MEGGGKQEEKKRHRGRRTEETGEREDPWREKGRTLLHPKTLLSYFNNFIQLTKRNSQVLQRINIFRRKIQKNAVVSTTRHRHHLRNQSRPKYELPPLSLFNFPSIFNLNLNYAYYAVTSDNLSDDRAKDTYAKLLVSHFHYFLPFLLNFFEFLCGKFECRWFL